MERDITRGHDQSGDKDEADHRDQESAGSSDNTGEDRRSTIRRRSFRHTPPSPPRLAPVNVFATLASVPMATGRWSRGVSLLSAPFTTRMPAKPLRSQP